jgi:hypothetical protein
MLGCNEIGPIRPIDMFFCGSMMLLAQVTNQFLFGEIVNINSQLNRKEVEDQRKIDNSNEVMNMLGIHVYDQDSIRYFIIKTKDAKDQQEDFDSFMNMIAPSKKVLI